MTKHLVKNKQSIQLGLFYVFAAILLFLGSYETAHANVFDNLSEAILDILNNTFLRVIAIIAVIIVGVRAFKGHMEWSSAIWVIVGIVIVFGAAGIVDFIIDNAGTV